MRAILTTVEYVVAGSVAVASVLAAIALVGYARHILTQSKLYDWEVEGL